jgi:hypothetical protein
MRNFLWKIAGADLQLLNRSNNESKNSFLLVGFLYLLVNLFSFWAFFGLFWGVFDNFLIACFAGVLLTFLISNIYQLNMMSLDPPSLPYNRQGGSISAAVILRYTTIALFAVFVSKAFETSILGFLVDSKLEEEIIKSGIGINKYEQSGMFVRHGQLLNQEYPEVWIITLTVVALFLAPIYIKRKLFGGHEYFRIKYRNDVALVEESYDRFMDELDAIHVKTYITYKKLDSDPTLGKFIPKDFSNKKYVVEESKYEDPPFNTKRRPSKTQLDSHEDFMGLEWK